MPAFTCSAVLHAVEWAGAEPVLLDTAAGAIFPDPAALSAVDLPVDAVIVVHPWGLPLDTTAWQDVAPIVIEDCAQSIGARRQERPVGTAGDVAVLSFYATKMLCAGEGGVVSAMDGAINERAGDLRDYDGKTEHAPRFNFKMSDLQAALAGVQWSRLDEFLERRRIIAGRYHEPLQAIGLMPILPDPGTVGSWYRYLCWAQTDIADLLEFCDSQGVHCRRPVPVTLDRLQGCDPLPNTGEAWHRVVSIPIYPSLAEDDQERVIAVLRQARERGHLG
jgi:dTDP-4-amino-4,6-dideoxygalactose transaminase